MPGDNVQVRVGGGDAWLVGNQTAPPTDDRTALEALESASIARSAATEAQVSAAAAGSAALDAQTAAQQATTDAATASVKADAASTAAAEAEAKATAAGTAAAAAGTAAAAAQTSADAAGTAASAAQTSAAAAGTAAQQAIADAGAAGRAASLAQAAADAAQGDIDAQQEWFWHDALGSHILGDTTGYRNDITSTGMDIVETSTQDSVAAFQATGARIGKTTGAHSVIDEDGQRFYSRDGNTQLANIGYGETEGKSAVVTAPYYTLGRRKSGGTIGEYSLAEGGNTTAAGSHSHAEGYNTTASGYYSHAEGYDTTASGGYSHAEGSQTTASNGYSHAEGYNTTASGYYSHAEGSQTTASGDFSHAEGGNTTASGGYSHASGFYTVAGYGRQTAIGGYNNNRYRNLFEIGNGTADNARSNALEVTRTGDVTAAGEITDGSGNVLSAKADASSIPTATSDLTNDSGFITNNVTGNFTASGDITAGGDITATGDITAGTVQDAAGNILADKADASAVFYQPGESVRLTGLTGTGYSTGTSGNYYFFLETPKQVPAGKTLTVTELTATIRGVNGVVTSNANIIANLSNILRGTNGCPRLLLTGLSTNYKANTPAHIVCTISFNIEEEKQ